MNPQQFGKKNVRYVTPEQLAAFAHQVVTAVLDDNIEDEARLRAMARLETFVTHLDQQSPDRDPLSRISRRHKRKLKPAEELLPITPVGGVSNADHLQSSVVRGTSDADPNVVVSTPIAAATE